MSLKLHYSFIISMFVGFTYIYMYLYYCVLNDYVESYIILCHRTILVFELFFLEFTLPQIRPPPLMSRRINIYHLACIYKASYTPCMDL
jgi:hypothetical protein